MTYKILFVCLGNICRSPAAENIMNHLVAQAGLSDQIITDSAGTANYHKGSPPDQRMMTAASQRGIPMQGKARQFKKEDFDKFDLILAMDRENYQDILWQDPDLKYRDKVKMMCDYCRYHNLKEVPDPYYGGPESFNEVINLLLDACQGLLESISQ